MAPAISKLLTLKREKNLVKTACRVPHKLDSRKTQSTIKRRISAHAGDLRSGTLALRKPVPRGNLFRWPDFEFREWFAGQDKAAA